jgi:hypothetical protein
MTLRASAEFRSGNYFFGPHPPGFFAWFNQWSSPSFSIAYLLSLRFVHDHLLESQVDTFKADYRASKTGVTK